jgi:hypothetical protein
MLPSIEKRRWRRVHEKMSAAFFRPSFVSRWDRGRYRSPGMVLDPLE